MLVIIYHQWNTEIEIKNWYKAWHRAHTCNPSYQGGGDQEDHGSRPAWAKSSQDPISTNKKWGIVMHACHPSMWESEDHSSGHKHKTLSQK
jgi:hypothetical protein